MSKQHNIDMKADAKQTKSAHTIYSKCAMSMTALKQQRRIICLDEPLLKKSTNLKELINKEKVLN